MDIREKLMELIKEVKFPTSPEGGWDVKVKNQVPEHGLMAIADHLLANGMTVQEWISVKDRLPKKDGAYLVTTDYFGKYQCINIRCFAKDGEAVDKYDLGEKKDVWYFYDSEYGYVSTDSVTHWMPLPEAPKGA